MIQLFLQKGRKYLQTFHLLKVTNPCLTPTAISFLQEHSPTLRQDRRRAFSYIAFAIIL